jgi:hypothetical protein
MPSLFQTEVNRLRALHDLIVDEVTSYNEVFGGESGSTDFARRCLYRTIFSTIEAYISHLKASALLFTIDQPNFFTESERLALRDLEPFVNEKGDVGTRPARIRLKDNLKLAFKLFARSQGREHQIDYQTSGGIAFTSAIKIRDRLTHPKDSKDWIIREQDAKMLLAAWTWFGEHLVKASRDNTCP